MDKLSQKNPKQILTHFLMDRKKTISCHGRQALTALMMLNTFMVPDADASLGPCVAAAWRGDDATTGRTTEAGH